MLTSIDFEVIFGSEEYPEWMSPYYADAFCFFVSEINGDIDPNFNSTPQNIMETGDIINNFDCDEIENKPKYKLINTKKDFEKIIQEIELKGICAIDT